MKYRQEEVNMLITALEASSRQYPMPISEIATLFRITNPSARARVADLRDKGYRVCSDTNGYWMASDEEDYLEYRKAYMHKILTRLERLKAMDNYGCLDGQIPFEFDLEQLKGVC